MAEEQRFVIRAREVREGEARFSHPWNPDSELYGTRLSSLVGLSRLGISRVRVPAGKESFVYHSHQREEEWIYVLSGRGMAEVDGEEFEVAAGDFMGFPAPQAAHHLRNPYDEDLVYLMGGEALNVDIADFPRLGKRMVRRGKRSRSTMAPTPKGSGRSTRSSFNPRSAGGCAISTRAIGLP